MTITKDDKNGSGSPLFSLDYVSGTLHAVTHSPPPPPVYKLRHYYCPHFTGEGTKTHGGKVTCSKSYN